MEADLLRDNGTAANRNGPESSVAAQPRGAEAATAAGLNNPVGAD
jgi:hypothetical protein